MGGPLRSHQSGNHCGSVCNASILVLTQMGGIVKKEETTVYDKLHQSFLKIIRVGWNWHWQRIESNLTSQGIPDINICFGGKEFWIECKVEDTPSPLQYSWIEQRRRAGGIVFVVEKHSDDGLILYADTWCAQFEYGGYDKLTMRILEEVLR